MTFRNRPFADLPWKLLGFKGRCLEKITGYVTDGFLFAVRILRPVILIGAFFFLGGEAGITVIMGGTESTGLMNDWACWLAQTHRSTGMLRLSSSW